MAISIQSLAGHIPLTSLLASAAGVAVFSLLGLPLPYLLGPMFACLMAALAGLQLRGTGQIGIAMRTVLGLAVGCTVSLELVGRLSGMLLSVAMVLPLILISGIIGTQYFRRLCHFDPVTSYYAAMPGGLQDMLLFGQEAGGNLRSLSLVHASRVLVIVTIAPLIMQFYYGTTLDRPPGLPISELPAFELGIMVLACLVGWKGGAAIGLFGAAIIGPLILGAAASLAGLVSHRPPAETMSVAQFFIGLSVGVHYSGITLRELRHDVAAALGYCVILGVLSLLMAEIVVLLQIAPPVEAFLSFAPGGQAEMALLAIVAGADVPYVVVHHLVRMVAVVLGAPMAARLTGVRRIGGN